MIGQRLEVRQGQGLVITPQLQQAIKLLQLSNLELEAFVEGELERNPLLQRDEGEAASDGPNEPVEAAASGEASELQFTEPSGEAERAMDARTEDLYDDAPGERDADRKRDAGETGEQPGLSDWSRAGGGGRIAIWRVKGDQALFTSTATKGAGGYSAGGTEAMSMDGTVVWGLLHPPGTAFMVH